MSISDFLIKAVTKDGSFRAIATSTSFLTEEARERHNLSHTATVALGRAFSCGVLLCNTLRKTKGHLTLKIQSTGPMLGLFVDVSNEGTVRGYVKKPEIECFDKKGYVSVSDAIGSSGYLHVTYDNEKGIPHNGTVELKDGEIVNDVANYLAYSEQINSFLSCGVYQEPKTGKVIHSGGILIQTLPGASDEKVKQLEETVSKLDPFSILLRSGLSLEEIIKKALGEFEVDIVSEFEGVCFHCGCSLERFENAIRTLPKEEVQSIIDEIGFAEGKCHFCSSTYKIEKEELKSFLKEIKE